jgi:SAM-dependent methyltransferase
MSNEENDKTVAPYVPLAGAGDAAALRLDARARFDQVAALYDRARPAYPRALFADLAVLAPHHDRILEIGCGTGQATRELANMADVVRCVELGAELARIARTNLAAHENVVVDVGAFEDIDAPAQTFDLIFSATAFHWIEPSVGYPLAARLLRSGGALALATHAHVSGGTERDIADEIGESHRRHCPDIGAWRLPDAPAVVAAAHAGGDISALWGRVERSFHGPTPVGHLFHMPTVRTYDWVQPYTSDDYVAFLETLAPYAALEPDTKARLFADLAGIVDGKLNGTILKRFVTILAVAGVKEGDAR